MAELLLPIAMKWAADANPGAFLQHVILFVIAFWLVKKYLFGDLEKQLKKLTDSVEGFKDALVELERNHDRRLDKVESDVDYLKNQLTKE